MFDKFILKILIRRTGIDQIINHMRMVVTRIDITRIDKMILGVMTIEEMIKIMAEISIRVTTVMIQDGMKITRVIIAVIVRIINMIVIIHLKEIMVTDNHTEEVSIKKNKSLIIFGGKI